MASFDVTDSAMKSYSFVWSERRYIARLALFPLLIKFVCSLLVSMNGYDFDFIKQSLIMLPSYFADGWVMSHLVRLIYLGQRWPFRPTGVPENDIAMLRDRAGGIMAGTVFFALLEFLKAGVMGMMLLSAPPGSFPKGEPSAVPDGGDVTGPVTQGPQAPALEGMSMGDMAHTAQSSPYTALFGLAMIVLTVWAARYLWLYIPAAAGFSGRAYLKRVGGMMGSIRLIGVWLMCAVPVLSAFVIFANIFLLPLGLHQGGALGAFVLKGADVIIGMSIAILTTAGMSFVIRSMFIKDKP